MDLYNKFHFWDLVSSMKRSNLKDFIDNIEPNSIEMRLGNTTLSLIDFKILTSSQWLNDEIINAYMSILQKMSKNTIILSTFTLNLEYQTFNHRILNSLPKNILTYEKIIFPVNHSAHWFIVEVDFLKQKFFIYDSLMGPPTINRVFDSLNLQCVPIGFSTKESSETF